MKSIKDLSNSLGIMASGTLFNLTIGLTQGILTARLLGLEDYGRYASLLAFAAIVARLNDMGLPHACSYFYRRFPEGLASLLRILTFNFIWCCFSAVLIVALIGAVSLPFLPSMGFSPWLLVALGVLIAVGTPLNILVATTMATGNYKFFVIMNNAAATLQMGLIIIAALTGKVSLGLFVGLAAVAQLLVVAGVMIYFVSRTRTTTAVRLTTGEVLRYGLSTHWGVLIKQLSLRFELIFVAGVLSPAQLGMYSLAISIRDAGLMPQAIYSAPLQNLIIDRNRLAGPSDDRSAILVSILLQLGLSTVLTIGAALALPILIPVLYGQAYAPSIAPSIILFASNIFVGAAGICWIAFNAKGHPHLTSTVLSITGIPTPLVIYLAASRYELYGGSIATLLMALLLFVVSFTGIMRLQRYSFSDVRAAFRFTPPFLTELVKVTVAQLRPYAGRQ